MMTTGVTVVNDSNTGISTEFDLFVAVQITFDVADRLRTPAEMAAYLDAWRQEAPDDAG